MGYDSGRYGQHAAECSNCGRRFVPPAENPPQPTTSGLRVECPGCSNDFVWSLEAKYTIWCDDCGLTDLMARHKPEWDSEGKYGIPCPGDDCDGHLRRAEWHQRRREWRKRQEGAGENMPESGAYSGAIEMPLYEPDTLEHEIPLPSAVLEAKREQRRKIDHILNGRRRRGRY